MGAIYILWLRELKRYVRSRVQIVVSLGQPCLYLLALGFGLGPVFRQAGHGSYLQFMAPGVVGMTVLFSSVFSGIAMLWDRQFGFLKETLVAPVSRMQIMVGRTLGGATVAVIQGTLILIICLIAGFRPHSWFAIPLAFLFVVMIAIVFAALPYPARGEETAVAPLAPMTTTPVLPTMVALVGKVNVTVKLREGTEPVRFVIATAMFSAVWPGPKVSVPLVAV